MSRYSISPTKKILGISFLSLVLVAATYVVTSGKFNMNPNKDAAMTCQGTCYRANLCDSLDRTTAVGSCSTGYVCCGAKYDGGSPTPAPTGTPKPKTPAPTPKCWEGEGAHKGCTPGEKTCYKWFLLTCAYDGCFTYKNCEDDNKICKEQNNTASCVAPTPTIEVSKITSGTCTEKCMSLNGSCVNVGTNADGNNSKIMTWTKWSSCYTRAGNCNSTVNNLTEATVSCSGTKPEWTNCRCKINPFVD